MKWSLHMIVKDAEHKLARTLDSVKSFVDEIIIVDTGSTDGTISLAESYGAKVSTFEWIDDFAAARNAALEQVTGDWALWLDAGDVFSPETIKRFEWIKKQPAVNDPNSPVNVIWSVLNRKKDDKNEVKYTINQPRIFKMSGNPRWRFAIHEELWMDSPSAILDDLLVIDDPEGGMEVASERNLRIIEKCIAEGRDVERSTFLRLGDLEVLGRYEDIAESIDELYKLPLDNFTFGQAYLTAARAFHQLKNEEKERENLLRSMLHDATRPEAYMYLGDLEFGKEKFNRAVPYYRAAAGMEPDIRRIQPTHLPHYTYAPYERLGYCFLGLNDTKKATDYLYEAIKRAPEAHAKNLKDIVRQLKSKK